MKKALALLALLAATALLSLASIREYRQIAQERSLLLERFDAAGLVGRHPEARSDLLREPDPARARFRLGRVLLADELDPSWRAELASSERSASADQGLVKLGWARDLARTNLETRPASWQSAMVLGAATFLELQRRRDPRRVSERGLWEAPLELAHRLAPDQPEPPRFLAAAYLGDWSSLPDDRRARLEELLPRTFESDTSFRLLIERWLTVAPSFERALAAMPTDPRAWRLLGDIFARHRDPERLCRARDGYWSHLPATVTKGMADAERHLERGDERRAALEFLGLAATLTPDRRYASQMENILKLMPARTLTRQAYFAADWLDWAIQLCLVGDCPLPRQAIARLGSLIDRGAPIQQALALVAQNDRHGADRLERRAFNASPGELDTYRRFRALWLDPAETAAESSKPSTPPVAGLDTIWSESRPGGPLHHELTLQETSTGVEIEILKTRSGATAVEISIDGQANGCFVVRRGSRLRLDQVVAPGRHLVGLKGPGGSGFVPGAIKVLSQPAN